MPGLYFDKPTGTITWTPNKKEAFTVVVYASDKLNNLLTPQLNPKVTFKIQILMSVILFLPI